MGVELAHRFAFELNAVSGVYDAVANGVRDGGVSDNLMPLGNGKLGAEDRGGAAVAVFEPTPISWTHG